mmetsp:Transcript_5831/g.13372  ORF Transcript_5831/g.13372 Transcript_5831/m.13372 type:complete len:405 (-) Transcript_5831:546-1760(-)
MRRRRVAQSQVVPERPERVARPRRLSKYIDPSLQGISSWDIFLLFITLTAPVWCVKGDDAKKVVFQMKEKVKEPLVSKKKNERRTQTQKTKDSVCPNHTSTILVTDQRRRRPLRPLRRLDDFSSLLSSPSDALDAAAPADAATATLSASTTSTGTAAPFSWLSSSPADDEAPFDAASAALRARNFAPRFGFGGPPVRFGAPESSARVTGASITCGPLSPSAPDGPALMSYVFSAPSTARTLSLFGAALFRYACCAVDSRLLTNQYSVRPLGTLSEKYPIISGRNFRMACDCCCAGSSDCVDGDMSFCVANCDTVSSTGSTRYAPASCHPMGGAPFSNGNSQLIPLPSLRAAMETGPPREGIQKKPSVRMPSLAAFVSARYSPIQMGSVASVGRHPASGLTPASR